MLRSRFLWKLFGLYAFLILTTVILVGSLVGRRIERDALEQTEQNLKSEALLLREIARSAAQGGGEPLQPRLEALGREVGARFTVIAGDGTVIADSHADPLLMENHARRPEIFGLVTQPVGVASRFSSSLGEERMYLALMIEPGHPERGYVRASLSLESVRARHSSLRGIIAVGTAIGAVIALVLSFVFARQTTRPLVALTAAADRLTSGSSEIGLDITSDDEIGRLARALGSMSRQLRGQLTTITTDRNQLTAILASMAEGLVAVDRNERIVHMNGVAGDLLGLRAEEVRGRPIWEVTRIPEISEALAETMEKAAAVERSIRLPGPADRIFHLRSTPLREASGALSGAVLVIDDVSKLRRLETIRQDFVANVSHELKTPVTAIRGFVETLIDDPDLPPATRRRFLEKVQTQSERLSNLVTDLLSLSRLEAETGALELEPIDARDPALASLQALRASAELKRLDVQATVPETALWVMADEEILRQAITNLLDNAIKYTPAGGRMWLRVLRKGDHAAIEVEDDGPGIDLRHQARVFERFYRVDKARSRQVGGTGLGLAIVKHVARAFGGTVTLDSTPGRGSLFRILLPCARQPVVT